MVGDEHAAARQPGQEPRGVGVPGVEVGADDDPNWSARPVASTVVDRRGAGRSQLWNSGVVVGDVSRIRMLERQMFGRAGFELLRKRVLLCS